METISFIHLGNYGQCGNQLFEIASVIGLCHRYGAKPAFPPNWKYRNEFNVPEEYFENVVPGYYISGHQKNYNPGLLENALKFKVVNITEYLQSEFYFYDIRKKIKSFLTPKGTIDLGERSVAIHIRRGDYVGHPYFQQLSPEYYHSAIRQYFSDQEYKFYVCSDDSAYCKEMFPGDSFIIEKRNEIDDLRILAGCRYHILSNSTFSWWGAYLSNSTLVIRPPKIFAGLYSKIRDETDYWPKDWVINDGLLTCFQNTCNCTDKNNVDPGNKTLIALRKITDTIILKASFVSKSGLLNGKMGICLYLYHFSRFTGNKIYEDYAGELLDDIFSSLSDKTPCDFENGLAGIGWGIEYLARTGFVEADTDEVLEELDQILLKKISSGSRLNFRFLSGITGIGFYFMSRVVKFGKNNSTKFAYKNEHLMIQFIEEIEKRTEKFKRPGSYYNGGNSIFDLSWDYFSLLCLMAEIHKLDIQREKVGNIILKLLSPLKKESNLPKMNVNMVLMMMFMEKLKTIQQNISSDINNSSAVSGTTDGIVENLRMLTKLINSNLLVRLNQDGLEKELDAMKIDGSGFLPGAIWLYREMFGLRYPDDEKEFVLWQKTSQKITNQVISSMWFEKYKPDCNNSITLREGLSSVGLQMLFYA